MTIFLLLFVASFLRVNGQWVPEKDVTTEVAQERQEDLLTQQRQDELENAKNVDSGSVIVTGYDSESIAITGYVEDSFVSMIGSCPPQTFVKRNGPVYVSFQFPESNVGTQFAVEAGQAYRHVVDDDTCYSLSWSDHSFECDEATGQFEKQSGSWFTTLGSVPVDCVAGGGSIQNQAQPYLHVANNLPLICPKKTIDVHNYPIHVRYDLPEGRKTVSIVSFTGGSVGRRMGGGSCIQTEWTDLRFFCDPVSVEWMVFSGFWRPQELLSCDSWQPGSTYTSNTDQEFLKVVDVTTRPPCPAVEFQQTNGPVQVVMQLPSELDQGASLTYKAGEVYRWHENKCFILQWTEHEYVCDVFSGEWELVDGSFLVPDQAPLRCYGVNGGPEVNIDQPYLRIVESTLAPVAVSVQPPLEAQHPELESGTYSFETAPLLSPLPTAIPTTATPSPTTSNPTALYVVPATPEPTAIPAMTPAPEPATRSPTSKQPTIPPTAIATAAIPATPKPSSSPPTPLPTPYPTKQPSPLPSTLMPTPISSPPPSTARPTPVPSPPPSTGKPTPAPPSPPTAGPTPVPSLPPSTIKPTPQPSNPPPTQEPTTLAPTVPPTNIATPKPTDKPTASPTARPSPTRSPHFELRTPTRNPTEDRVVSADASHTSQQYIVPIGKPTTTPSSTPSSAIPTPVPSPPPSTGNPTPKPSTPPPTQAPTTLAPTVPPSNIATPKPTDRPTLSPTAQPSPTRSPHFEVRTPSRDPTRQPIISMNASHTSDQYIVPAPNKTTSPPSSKPTTPTVVPTLYPSMTTTMPASSPSGEPTSPTLSPSETHTSLPTRRPSETPTSVPTLSPSETHTSLPIRRPSETPTPHPSEAHTLLPTRRPSENPTSLPIPSPSDTPTTVPTVSEPTASPTQTGTIGSTSQPPTQSFTNEQIAIPSVTTNMPTSDPTSQPLVVSATEALTSAPTSATSSEAPSTANPTTSEPIHCGCPLCTDAYWNKDASGYSCGERIAYILTVTGGGTQSDACRQVAGEEFPAICGPHCDPDKCLLLNMPTTSPASQTPSPSAPLILVSDAEKPTPSLRLVSSARHPGWGGLLSVVVLVFRDLLV